MPKINNVMSLKKELPDINNIAKDFTKAYELLKEKYLTDKKLLDKKNMLTNKNVLYSSESKYKKLLNSQTCFEDIISN